MTRKTLQLAGKRQSVGRLPIAPLPISSFLRGLALTVLALVFASAGALMAADRNKEISTTLADQQKVSVTIYNQDLALVKDTRTITLQSGLNELAFREVSAKIRPETALLRSRTHPEGISLLEQNFDFDLLTPQKLLEKFVGQDVGVIRTHPTTGAETEEQARVLSANQGVVLRIGDRIETGVPGRLVYRRIPDTLRERPTLVMQLDSATAQPQQLELSYLTGGLAWKADYVAELSDQEDRLDVNGWVSLTNQSGTAYPKARLQLVAGDVHRVRETLQPAPRVLAQAKMAAQQDQMSEESLFDYHLYTLQRPTTIADNQTKQVALLSAAQVPVRKEYVLRGQDYYYRASHPDLGKKLKVGVFMELANREENHLGVPLPKGTVRVYKRDSSGNVQFVGEDRIDHTPKNALVRLKLGDAFDVTASKKQTDFQKRPAVGEYRYAFASSYAIDLENAKTQGVTVIVREPVPGDWKIEAESQPHTKESSGIAAWRVRVPPEKSVRLNYRVLVRF